MYRTRLIYLYAECVLKQLNPDGSRVGFLLFLEIIREIVRSQLSHCIVFNFNTVSIKLVIVVPPWFHSIIALFPQFDAMIFSSVCYS